VSDVLSVFTNPDIPFFRYAIIAGILASIPFGIIGTYVVVRRISYIAGAISHCVLGGIGIGLFCQQVLDVAWFTPQTGAAIVALCAAILLAFVSLFAKQREDSVIGALWAGGMATGLLFLAKTPGYIDPMSYLFGNILLITKTDLYFISILSFAVVAVVYYFYNSFLVLCFDEEYARLRGVKTSWLYLLLLCLTALTIVLLVRIVGIVMVIALLTLPAAISGNFAKNILQMILGAILLCMFFVVTGLGMSYNLDLPSGPTIILLAASCYLFLVVGQKLYLKYSK
jgi:zinc transport system permease protein